MYSTKVFHRVAKVQEPPEDVSELSKKNAMSEDKVRHPLPLVDHLPEAALEPFTQNMNNDEAFGGIFAENSPAEPKEKQVQEISTTSETVGKKDTEGARDEVDPFESSYYIIDKLLTKLINIGIERNECQLRRVDVLKDLEKAKKLHDYLNSLQGLSGPNGALIQRQEGAYIFNILLIL